jgi:hypothetical protein
VGTVVDLTDEYVVVETTPGVKLKFTKQAIAGVVPPETPELDAYGTDPELETESEDAEPAAEAGADEPEDAKDEQKV